jgi:signal transduction histidine kinase
MAAAAKGKRAVAPLAQAVPADLLDLIGRARLVTDLDQAADLLDVLIRVPGVTAAVLVPPGASLPPIPSGSAAWPLGSGSNASVLIVDVAADSAAIVRDRVNSFATALDGALRRAPQRREGDRPGEDSAQVARSLQAVLDGVPALVLTVRPDCAFAAGTARTGRLVDLMSAEIAETGVLALVHPADRELAAAVFRAALEGAEPASPLELRVRTPDDQWASLRVGVHSLVDNPDVHGVVWYALDEPPGAASDEFLRNVSHLLRTPLTAVISFAELLADEEDLDERPREFVRAVQRNAERLRMLAEDVLQLVRLESGAVRLSTGPVPVGDLLTLVSATVQSSASSAGVHLRIDAGEGLPLSGDEAWLQRALETVLERAIRVSPAGAEVGVTARTEGAGWLIRVRDTGPRAVEDEVALSAGRLVRRHAGESSQAHHLGFELLIARAAVNRHGGRIVADSPGGIGAVVDIWLPASTHY